MRPLFGLAIGLSLTGSAMAASSRTAGDDTVGKRSGQLLSAPSEPMRGLDMVQKMAICEKLEKARQTGAALTPAMQAQDAACRRMDSDMISGTAPEATQER